MGDVVKFRAVGAQDGRVGLSPGHIGCAGDAKIEGLLAIRMVALGDIVADDQGKVVDAEIFLEQSHVHAFFGENLLFGAVDRIDQSRRQRIRANLGRVQFPKGAGISD